MSKALLLLAIVGGSVVGLGPARAFDGTKTPNTVSPVEAFQSALRADQSGDKKAAISALEFAAGKGHAIAQWKLGRMYAEGDGVSEDDLKAFDYFSQIANMHADDNPRTVEARFVANAFVALGNYYLEGIPNTRVAADPGRAHAMFTYAATYFGDPDAQYNLARIYLDGTGVTKDARQAARWLGLAANKGQREAQALLGHLLFVGKDVPRQAARGLMWLTLANDAAGPKDRWIVDLYDKAQKAATSEDRSMAETYVEQWLKGRS